MKSNSLGKFIFIIISMLGLLASLELFRFYNGLQYGNGDNIFAYGYSIFFADISELAKNLIYGNFPNSHGGILSLIFVIFGTYFYLDGKSKSNENNKISGLYLIFSALIIFIIFATFSMAYISSQIELLRILK